MAVFEKWNSAIDRMEDDILEDQNYDGDLKTVLEFTGIGLSNLPLISITRVQNYDDEM